jgi:hypothetical protein
MAMTCPTIWERIHFGNPHQVAYGDYDADGISNLQEYLNATNPASGVGLQTFTPLN